MWRLMKSEISRFRNLAMVLAGVHLLVLVVLLVTGELFAAREDAVQFGGVIYSLSGLIFGLYQLGSYRQRHLWFYLLHRPVAPVRIFLSLAAAAIVLFIAVFLMPWAFVLLTSDLSDWLWVDWRHYLMIPFILGVQLAFYLIGCFIMLSPCRAAFLLLVAPLFFFTREAVGGWVFVPLAVVLLLTGYLACSAFKPDLSAYPRRPTAVALTALPIQYVAFWVLQVVFLIIYSTFVAFAEQGWRSLVWHSWDRYFAEGTFIRAEYMSSDEALAHGLSDGSFEGVDALDLLPRWGSRSTKPQTRGQLMFMDRGGVWYDQSNSVRWAFSHETMLFHGRNWLTGAFVGWLGSSGGVVSRAEEATPFGNNGGIPSSDDVSMAYTHQRIYDFDFKRQSFDLRFEVTGDESLITRWIDHEDFAAVLSDRAVYLFEPANVSPIATLAWQGEVRNLSRVLVARQGDAFLVSLIFGQHSEREIHEARQTTVRLGLGGGTETLLDKPLGHGPPAWARHRGFIISPLIQILHDSVWSAIEPYSDFHVGLENVLKLPRSPSTWGRAFLFALISCLLTHLFARRRGLDPTPRWAWTVASFFVGAPAFISFLFLTTHNLES